MTLFYWIDDQYTAESYLFFAFGLCMLFAVSRPLDLVRSRVSMRRKLAAPAPEPEAGLTGE